MGTPLNQVRIGAIETIWQSSTLEKNEIAAIIDEVIYEAQSPFNVLL
jgi:hypothetical protein